MTRTASTLSIVVSLMRGGHASLVTAKLRRALWSEQRYTVLRRDLVASADLSSGTVAFAIRPFAAGDIAMLDGDPVSAEDARARAKRRLWINDGLPGCYVATVDGGPACYMQWLLRPSDNDRIRADFGNHLPQLDADTVQLEGAYTPPRYRRIPIMPAAMARIAGLGRAGGAKQAIVSISERNASMIKAAQWAGFVPERVQVDRMRLFHRFVTYAALPQPAAPALLRGSVV